MSITTLTQTALDNAKRLDEFIALQKLDEGCLNGHPSGQLWKSLPPDLEGSRRALEDAVHELQHRVRGPGAMVYEHLFRVRPSPTSLDSQSWLIIALEVHGYIYMALHLQVQDTPTGSA